MQDVTFANCISTQKHMWTALHFLTKFSMTFFFQLKRSLKDLSRSLYLLLSKVSVLARWSSSFSSERICKGLFRKTEKKIHFYVIPVFYDIAVLVLLLDMYLYLSLMIKNKNTEEKIDFFSGSLKHFVFTAGSC